MNKIVTIALTILLSVPAFAQQMEKAQWKLRYQSEMIDGIYIPKDINDAISVLDTMFSEKDKIFITDSLSERDFSARLHLSFGMWLRNNWGLWGGSRLSSFFNDMRIYHPDDMSGIVLDSYYRYLKGQDLDIEGQVEHYLEYWNNYKTPFFKKQWRKIKNRFYAIGDNRHARSELRDWGLTKCSTVLYAHPYGFSSQEESDLYDEGVRAKGIVKRTKVAGGQAYYEVQLLEAQSPYGIIIFDGSIEADEQTVRDTSFNPDNKSVFFMKPGESYWFRIEKLLDFWECEE